MLLKVFRGAEMKRCVDGSKTHEECEDIGEYTVCHDCEQTLGRKTEVYSRVVGYLRPTDGWNPGKKSEFQLRRTFLMRSPA